MNCVVYATVTKNRLQSPQYQVVQTASPSSVHEESFLVGVFGTCLANVQEKVLLVLVLTTVASLMSGYTSPFLQIFLTPGDTSTKPGGIEKHRATGIPGQVLGWVL